MDESRDKPSGPAEQSAEERERSPDARDEDARDRHVTRRGFLGGVGASAVAVAVAPAVSTPSVEADEIEASIVTVGPVTLDVNGQAHTIPNLEARTTLLDALRARLGLTGAKPVCERASCGACTVLLDGKPVNACSILAMDAEGKSIRTVEDLDKGGELHPVQEAFIEHDALMCGFCTPGFVMSLVAYLESHSDPTLDEIKQAVSGNLCRCGTYTRVFEAGLSASRRMREGA